MSEQKFTTLADLEEGFYRVVECGPRRYKVRKLSLADSLLIAECLPVAGESPPPGGRRKQGAPIPDRKGDAERLQANLRLVCAAIVEPEIPVEKAYLIPQSDFVILIQAITEHSGLVSPFVESPGDSGNSS